MLQPIVTCIASLNHAHDFISKLKRGKKPIHSSVGRVDPPGECDKFKLGQRVYFHLGNKGEVIFALRPKRVYKGRVLSSRVRRGTSSLAMYGPRAKAATARA